MVHVVNPEQHLLLIKGEDKTDEILRIAWEIDRCAITFKNERVYRYSHRNVQWLSDPVRIPVDNVRFSMNGDLLSDVGQALRFGSWVKIFHTGGGSRCCPIGMFSTEPVKQPDGRSKDLLAYFRELAEESTLRTDENEALLAMKYRHLNSVSRDSILSSFLLNILPGPESIPSGQWPALIFPFGCNMTQKKAVETALRNPISLIQGPPGTGKTQTILNLIANLLLQRKHVAVVSNNNSATANVLEKLKKYELGFVAAFLGSNENRAAFIASQSAAAIKMPLLQDREESTVRAEIFRLNQELDNAFEMKNALSATIQQLDALRLEFTHFEQFQRETEYAPSNAEGQEFRTNASARELMTYWVTCERAAERHRNTPAHEVSSEGAFSQTALMKAFHKAYRHCVRLLKSIHLWWRFGPAGRLFLEKDLDTCIPILQRAYYLRKIDELESSRRSLENSLSGFRYDERLKRLSDLSMRLLKGHLARRYNNRARTIFSLRNISAKTKAFLDEYPVILSTTFSVITSLKSGHLFECIIVDEASQVDLLNGGLAMACAKKLVVVGDPMQLPNVVTQQDVARARRIAQSYEVPEYAKFERHNLLSSVRAAFPGIPVTLLREHYRCHPKIIGFCNQKFYGGELLVMTRDQGERDVLKAYVTVEGRHARGNFNQRQIDEIAQTVLPELGGVPASSIGIVSPYRMQASRIRDAVGSNEIEVDTVHKYQGREKPVMILTTVANEVNDFVDNPNLFNVAVSRAQEKLWVVLSKEMAEGRGNIADFVRYVRYQNCEIIPGKVRSIFDLLYREYAEMRMEVLKKSKRVSQYDSENIAYGEIESVLREEAHQGYGIVSQFPLSMLVQHMEHLTPEESSYAKHPWTKTDFLIYRKVDKSPVLAIEVDGYAFHREGTRQAERDTLKDSVFTKCGLPFLRLSTVGSGERQHIRNKLADVTG